MTRDPGARVEFFSLRPANFVCPFFVAFFLYPVSRLQSQIKVLVQD
jgi:hypothetical protein